MTLLTDFVAPQLPERAEQVMIQEASDCLDRFTSAFNACDTQAMDRELHFPHIMLSGSERIVWQQPGQHPPEFFETLKATGWVRTQYESKTPVLVSRHKVHFLVVYSRSDCNHKPITQHTNLWIVTAQEGKWGIALRSY
jgi:hypothetical protein